MRVLLFGPTSAAGSALLAQCLAHPDITRVTILHRYNTGIQHPKLQDRLHTDFTQYEGLEPLLATTDVCFFCLGSSEMHGKTRQEYMRITHDYPVAAAKALYNCNPDVRFCFLSAAGADPTGKSAIAFAAAKGLAEHSLSSFGLKNLYIFRPGYIHPAHPFNGNPNGERFSGLLYPVLKYLTPGIVIHANVLAAGMLEVALHGSSEHIFTNQMIKRLTRTAFRQHQVAPVPHH